MKRFNYLTLAALVAVAACDEGVDPVVAPVTGTIVGVVTIEAEAAAGVSVTLSSGPTATTDAEGAFQFDDIVTGSYTVTISGFADDATFTSILKVATISSTGQVVTANFDGSYVRTSAIIGSVEVGGNGIPGVSIAIGGMAAAGTITDTNGAYSFSGLRAGSYTVEMTNPNSASYHFGTTTASVSLATGASEIVAFQGSLVTTASISGSLFIDEFNKDSIQSVPFEDNLKIANVPVTLEGILVLDTMTVLTDANGNFTFPGLVEGPYRIEIASMALIPGMVTFSGVNPQTTTVATGEAGNIDFPFSITTQAINVSGFLGVDTTNPGVTAIKGWIFNLYDTQLHAAAGGATGRLGVDTTDVAGNATFRFLRSKDVSPNAATTDRIVFAQIAAAPTVGHSTSGEAIIEIPYNSRDSMSMAPDTFDALFNTITVAFNGQETDSDKLAGWTAELRVNKDTTAAVLKSSPLDAAAGWVYWTLGTASSTSDGVLPDTFYTTLATAQVNAKGHGFTQAATSVEATTSGRHVKFIWDGTVSPNDTVHIGTSTVTYTDVHVLVGVHQENDDSTDVATYSKGDIISVVAGSSELELYNTTTGTPVSDGAAAAPGTGLDADLHTPKVNELTYKNLAVASTWQVRGRSTNVNYDMLNDSMVDFTLTGANQVDSVGAMAGSRGPSAFAMKANNTAITGKILSVDGVTPVVGMRVTVSATSDNIQANRTDTTVVTNASGEFTLGLLREGPYTVTVQDSAGVWAFTDTLTKVTQDGNVAADEAIPSAGVEGVEPGTAVVNTDAFSGTRDVEGIGSISTVRFAANRMDTKVQGVVVNDRDVDLNTVDPEEGLAGVIMDLYDDADGDGVVDSDETIVATDTTDTGGLYGFSGLREDNYIVQAQTIAGATVLRALSIGGVVTKTAAVLTTGVTGANATLNQSGTKQAGNNDPAGQGDELPRWNYLTGAAADDAGGGLPAVGPNSLNSATTMAPTHFSFLFSSGTVNGTVTDGAGTPVGIEGITITLRRCQTAASSPANPIVGKCTAAHTPGSDYISTSDTDAAGTYSFSGVLEGLYEVSLALSGGYSTIDTPAGGVKTYLFRVGQTPVQNDVVTVPAFKIS
jgi:hypothetical protein